MGEPYLSPAALAYLRTHVGDDWRLQPPEYMPGVMVRQLAKLGLIKIERRRPAPGAPYRTKIKRTEAGAARVESTAND